MIEIGQCVKCLLKNNAIAEGYVVEWTDQHVKLISLDQTSFLIIHHPNEDIVLTKIFLDDNSPEEVPTNEGTPEVAVSERLKEVVNPDGTIKPETLSQLDLSKEFQNVYEQPSSDDLRIKKLAELKVEMAKQDRKIIAEKLKNHHIDGTKKVEYGYPGFFKKPSTK